MKGKNHPMYGKHHTKESRRKMSVTIKNRMNGGLIQPTFKKGNIPWNKGMKGYSHSGSFKKGNKHVYKE